MLFHSSRGYYRENIRISCKYPRSLDIIRIPCKYLGSVDIIHILWTLSAFCGNIHVLWILSAFCLLYFSHFTHLVKVTGASLLFLFVT